jgi:phosphoglycolate phosphatase-like HAD superfamily hydrolase
MDKMRAGTSEPDEYLVPGSRAMLEDLRTRGISLYLASGTDDVQLKEEAELLDIARYFDGGIYGALPDPSAFSKRMLFERLVALPGMRADRLIGFGDGPVEIEELKRVRALAVGLATDEPECREASPWKRRNLIAIGADYIVPNYHCRAALVPMLLAEHEPL